MLLRVPSSGAVRMTTSHIVLRGSGPGQNRAFHDVMALCVVLIAGAAPGLGRSFIHVKPLREIVVGTPVQSVDNRPFAVARRQHEHRHSKTFVLNK